MAQRIPFETNRPIMIIDDSPVYQVALRSLFQQLRFDMRQLIVCANARSACQCERLDQVQLLLIDYNLGGGASGYQLLEYLRSKSCLAADCIVLIVTADASSTVVRQFTELYPDGFLIKPVNPAILSSRLSKLFAEKRALRKALYAEQALLYSQALKQAQQIAIEQPQYAQSTHYLKARVYLAQSDYSQALQALDQAPNQTHYDLQFLKARIHTAQHQVEAAKAILEPLTLNPINAAKAHYRLALLAIETSQYPEALNQLSRCLVLSPENLTKRKQHVLLLQINQRWTESSQQAQQLFRRLSTNLDSNLPLFYLNTSAGLDWVHFEGFKHYSAANALVDAAFKRMRACASPQQLNLFEQLLYARFQVVQGYQEQAKLRLEQLKQWLQVNRVSLTNPFEYYEQAKAYLTVGEQALAQQAAERAQALAEQHLSRVDAQLLKQAYLSWVQYFNNHNNQQRQRRKKAKQCLMLAKQLKQNNKPRAALEHAMQAVQSDVNYPAAARLFISLLALENDSNLDPILTRDLVRSSRDLLEHTETNITNKEWQHCASLAVQFGFSNLSTLQICKES